MFAALVLIRVNRLLVCPLTVAARVLTVLETMRIFASLVLINVTSAFEREIVLFVIAFVTRAGESGKKPRALVICAEVGAKDAPSINALPGLLVVTTKPLVPVMVRIPGV